MKVLFLTTRKDSPSTRWRILQFIPHFAKAGVECDVEELPGGMLARLTAARRAGDYDVVVLQKRLLPKLQINSLRKAAKSLLFEFDDVMSLKKTSEGAVRESPTRERRFRRTIRLADAVVTTNEHLADLARRAGGAEERVQVVPTVIDLARWPRRAGGEARERMTVGWMGTPSNLPSLELLRAPLVRLCRRIENLHLKVVCEEGLALEGVRMTHKPYAAGEEVEDVFSFDVAVAPLVEDAWTRGKVSTKLLAYFAAGLPVVASDVQANRLYLRDGENGFLAGTLGQWEERLALLAENPALRGEMGARARAVVERDYSIEAVLPRYLSLFESLSG